MTRTYLFDAPESWIQWIFSKDSFLFRVAILISWTLHRMLHNGMK